eukprot:TRINITY_DN31345_c0_g1_i4.p1 TRINITY_DN31345_c0_g1~~TRINITY_DN31345_c0_g1_i4.p1  ORF type:complete len:1202 (+),score=221.23 TRINITY_DN31345_c0_g1_i4:68-3673(+)
MASSRDRGMAGSGGRGGGSDQISVRIRPHAFKVLIPEPLVGSLLGQRNGSTPKEDIQSSCNVRLTLSNRDEHFPGTRLRVVIVHADEGAQVMSALARLVDKVVEAASQERENSHRSEPEFMGRGPGEITFRVIIPRVMTELLIGPHGCALNMLRQETGCVAIPDRESFENHLLMRLLGPPPVVKHALEKLLAALDRSAGQEAFLLWASLRQFPSNTTAKVDSCASSARDFINSSGCHGPGPLGTDAVIGGPIGFPGHPLPHMNARGGAGGDDVDRLRDRDRDRDRGRDIRDRDRDRDRDRREERRENREDRRDDRDRARGADDRGRDRNRERSRPCDDRVRGLAHPVLEMMSVISRVFPDGGLDVDYSVSCDLPDKRCGALIGKRGEYVDWVQRVTGARVRFEGSEEARRREDGARSVTVVGKLLQVYTAHMLMMKRYLDNEKGFGDGNEDDRGLRAELEAIQKGASGVASSRRRLSSPPPSRERQDPKAAENEDAWYDVDALRRLRRRAEEAGHLGEPSVRRRGGSVGSGSPQRSRSRDERSRSRQRSRSVDLSRHGPSGRGGAGQVFFMGQPVPGNPEWESSADAACDRSVGGGGAAGVGAYAVGGAGIDVGGYDGSWEGGADVNRTVGSIGGTYKMHVEDGAFGGGAVGAFRANQPNAMMSMGVDGTVEDEAAADAATAAAAAAVVSAAATAASAEYGEANVLTAVGAEACGEAVFNHAHQNNWVGGAALSGSDAFFEQITLRAESKDVLEEGGVVVRTWSDGSAAKPIVNWDDAVRRGCLAPALRASLDGLGHEVPTVVQRYSMPIIAQRQLDCVVESPAGSGKTLAFILPLVSRILMYPAVVRPHVLGAMAQASPLALVFAPTRELVVHTGAKIREIALSANASKINVLVLYSGESLSVQTKPIEKCQFDIVCATPDRLTEVIDANKLSLAYTSAVVLDEADRLLSPEQGLDVKVSDALFGRDMPNEGRQTLVFANQFPTLLATYVAGGLRTPPDLSAIQVRQAITEADAAVPETRTGLETVDQRLVWVRSDAERWSRLGGDLVGLLRTCEESLQRGIVFANRFVQANALCALLKRKPYNLRCVHVHGKLTQEQRLQAMQQFRKGELDVIIATNVAGRGLDEFVDEVGVVVQADVPATLEAYVERVRRTGRNGTSGKAVAYVCDKDLALLPELGVVSGRQQEVAMWLQDETLRAGL